MFTRLLDGWTLKPAKSQNSQNRAGQDIAHGKVGERWPRNSVPVDAVGPGAAAPSGHTESRQRKDHDHQVMQMANVPQQPLREVQRMSPIDQPHPQSGVS